MFEMRGGRMVLTQRLPDVEAAAMIATAVAAQGSGGGGGGGTGGSDAPPAGAGRGAPLSAFDPDDQVLCTVCQCDFVEDEVLRILPCLHRFHQACVDPWLGEHSVCPLCKANIMDSVC